MRVDRSFVEPEQAGNAETGSQPYAFGGPAGSGRIRCAFEDFQVDEKLGFACSGDGEHQYLRVEKRGWNTEQVARHLARVASVRYRDVGYAGLKDRRAQTCQWFSVRLPTREAMDWCDAESESLKVLESCRHLRKLKKGSVVENRFSIVVRDVQADRERLEQRLDQIRCEGVPNYYGPQRFGRDGRNLQDSRALLLGRLSVKDRFRRGILYSAARSALFNRILAVRVQQQDWNRGIDGDALMFNGSGAYFVAEIIDNELHKRLEKGEIHPSGALWGNGASALQGDAFELEARIVWENAELCEGLERCGLKMSRRALRLLTRALEWQWLDSDVLRLEFSLPAGGYATTVLRELLEVEG